MVRYDDLKPGQQILPKFAIRATPEMRAREGKLIEIVGRPPAYRQMPDAWDYTWEGRDYTLTPNQHGPDADFRDPNQGNTAAAAGRRLRLKTLRKSHNKAKKWDAVFENPDGSTKTVPFGQKGQSDFTKHKDKTRRQRQIDRHARMGENWNDPATPGALSRYILWNKPTLKGSLRDFKKRFHV